MEELKAVALTHKNSDLDHIGLFHLNDVERSSVLAGIKEKFALRELMYLSTCNRVELIFSFENYFCSGQARSVFEALAQGKNIPDSVLDNLEVHNGREALEHMIRVASSLDSMVIGEREIITQVRKSFEEAWENGTGGDLLRLCVRRTIETAKKIYTETQIATKPVSTVSLAWQKFSESGIHKHDGVILIGAGQMIRNFSRFLLKQGYSNVCIYNRSLENATSIANSLQANAYPLSALCDHPENIRAIISCTGATDFILEQEDFLSLHEKHTGKKLIIDMALPADIPEEVSKLPGVTYFGMKTLQKEASKNISARKQEIEACEKIISQSIEEFEKVYMQRNLEIALREIPQRIKEIKEKALTQVFAKELQKMDDETRAVLENIIQYMEKKYISVPMKMAKEVMIDKVTSNA